MRWMLKPGTVIRTSQGDYYTVVKFNSGIRFNNLNVVEGRPPFRPWKKAR